MSDANQDVLPTPTPARSSSDNPYVGPRSFSREQAHLYFGREQESEELFSRVVSQRLVLFYAQSGAGKSSLINTQLIPRLEGAGFVVLPVGRVGGDLHQGMQEAVDNIYLFNLMLNLDQSQDHPIRFAHLKLTDFLGNLTSEDGKRWLYESGDSAQRVPQPALQTPNYVLIIDQFEEIFTSHNERWREREEFFRELNAAMLADPSLWVLLTLREDFVASLDPYAHLMHDKLRARYYMQRMGIAVARDAIRKPAEQFQRHFQPEAVEMLVSNLSQVRVAGKANTESGQFVEPVQLQVVCYQLWEKLKNRLAPLITTEDVRRAGDVDSALANFYETTLSAALQSHPLAGSERRLRNWFEKNLITEAATRGTVYQGENETAGLPNELVLELANRFLLRSESRAGGRWIELTHDRFVEPIVAANRAWELSQSNPLTVITRLWLENGHDPARLLTGKQLNDAQNFAHEQSDLLTADETAFLQASTQAAAQEQARLAEAERLAEMARLHAQADTQRRRTRNLWRVVSIVTALALLALIATGWALAQRSSAKQSAQNAATAEAQAINEAQNAQRSQATAEAARAVTGQLQQQIQADRIAQIASLTNINKDLP